MPRLINAKTGSLDWVSDDEAGAKLSSGEYTYPEEVGVKTSGGAPVTIPGKDVPLASGLGYSQATPKELHEADVERAYGDQPITALLEGAAGTLLPGSTTILKEIHGGSQGMVERAKSTAGQVGKYGAMLLPVGAPGAVGKLGGAVTGVAGRVAGGVAEGAGYGLIDVLAEEGLSNDPINIEHIMAAVGSSAVVGGVAGGTAALISKGASAAKNFTANMLKKGTPEIDLGAVAAEGEAGIAQAAKQAEDNLIKTRFETDASLKKVYEETDAILTETNTRNTDLIARARAEADDIVKSAAEGKALATARAEADEIVARATARANKNALDANRRAEALIRATPEGKELATEILSLREKYRSYIKTAQSLKAAGMTSEAAKLGGSSARSFGNLANLPEDLVEEPWKALNTLQLHRTYLNKLISETPNIRLGLAQRGRGPLPTQLEGGKGWQFLDEVPKLLRENEILTESIRKAKGLNSRLKEFEAAKNLAEQEVKSAERLAAKRLEAGRLEQRGLDLKASQAQRELEKVESYAAKERQSVEKLTARQRDAAEKEANLALSQAEKQGMKDISAAERMAAKQYSAAERELTVHQTNNKPTLVKRLLQSLVFGGVTNTLSSVVGGRAAIVGGWAASHVTRDVLGKLGTKLGDGANRAAMAANSAIKTFFRATEAGSKRLAPLAVKALQEPLASPESVEAGIPLQRPSRPSTDKTRALYEKRMEEVKAQTVMDMNLMMPVMKPQAREAVGQNLAGVALIDPKLADRMETVTARRTEFLAAKAPKNPGMPGWEASHGDIDKWARYLDASNRPIGVLDRMANGSMTPEDVETIKTVFPELYREWTNQILIEVGKIGGPKKLPYWKRLMVSMFTGVPQDPSLYSNVVAVFQSNYQNEPGTEGGTQAPSIDPNFGKMGSTKKGEDTEATKAQELSS